MNKGGVVGSRSNRACRCDQNSAFQQGQGEAKIEDDRGNFSCSGKGMTKEKNFAPVSPSGALPALLSSCSAPGRVRAGRSPHAACGGGTHGGERAGRSAVRSAEARSPRRALALSAGFGSCRFPSCRTGFAAAGASRLRVLRAGLRAAGRAGRGRGAGGSRKRTQVRAGGSEPSRAHLPERVRPSPALRGRGCSGRCSPSRECWRAGLGCAGLGCAGLAWPPPPSRASVLRPEWFNFRT